MHIFRKLKAWFENKRFITKQQRGQWTPGGIVAAVISLLLVLVLLRAFGLI